MSLPNQNQLNSTVPFTPIPNSILASWAKQYNLAEIRVLMFLAIKLWGWHKTMDRISLSQFEEGTALTRSNVIIAIKSLCKKGVIRKLKIGEKGKEEVYYQLVLLEESNNSYQYCSNTTPVLQQYPQKKEEIKKEKIYKKEKEISEKLYIHGCISLPESDYEEMVKTHTKAYIDRIVHEMDTYYTRHPDKAKKHGRYASTLRFWIQNDLKKRASKKEAEELAFRKGEEEDRQYQIEQEKIQAEKKRQEAIQRKILEQKIQEKIPIVKKFEQKFPGIVKLCRIWQNGICEIKDSLHQIHSVFMQYDDFEEQVERKLVQLGYLC